MKLFCILNVHLRQLRVTLKIEAQDDLGGRFSQSSSWVFTLKCNNNDMIISRQIEDLIQTSMLSFPPTISFPSFQEEIPITDSKESILSFCVRNVNLSPLILKEISDVQVKRSETQLKPNPDLMNDWIFCHHSHSYNDQCREEKEDDLQTNASSCRKEKDNKSHLDSESRIKNNGKNNVETEVSLESLQELLSFLSTQSNAGRKVLLETSEPMREDSLLLHILSPYTLVLTASFEFGKNCPELLSQVVCLFHFTDISLRKRQIPLLVQETITTGQECRDIPDGKDDDKRAEDALRQQLKSLRLSFDIEFMKVEKETFCQTRHLIASSTSLCLSEVTSTDTESLLPSCLAFLVL
jgi:hypothetical protein